MTAHRPINNPEYVEQNASNRKGENNAAAR